MTAGPTEGKPSPEAGPVDVDPAAGPVVAAPAVAGSVVAAVEPAFGDAGPAEAGDWMARVMGRSIGPAADEAIRRSHAIITATGRLVQRAGGDDFTMRQVAEEAKLSLRAVYKHFAGKDELLVALVEEAQVVYAQLLERRIAHHDDPLEKLGAAIHFSIDHSQHTDHAYNAALARYVVQLSVSAPDQLSVARRPVVEVLKRVIGDAMAAGELAPADPEQAATTLSLAFSAYQWSRYLGNFSGGTLPSTEDVVTFCLRGLGADLPAGWAEHVRTPGPQPDQ